jgi:hypothetical protein
MQFSSRLRVAIAGAGSTGLGLATLLRQRGHVVSIYGKSPPPPSHSPIAAFPPSIPLACPVLPSSQFHSLLLSREICGGATAGEWSTAATHWCEPPPPSPARLTRHRHTGLAVLAHIGADEDILKLGAKVQHLDGRTVDDRIVFDLNYDLLGKRAFGLGVHRASLFKGETNKSSSDCHPLLVHHCPPPLPPQFSSNMRQKPAPTSTHHSMSPPRSNTLTTPSASAQCVVQATGLSIWSLIAADDTASSSTQHPTTLH